MRAELRAALAEFAETERMQAEEKEVPLEEAARHIGITGKALRSRIERGSIEGARKIGGRWHVTLGAARSAKK